MKKFGLFFATLVAFFAFAAPAAAQSDYVFGFSGASAWTLTVNGTQNFTSVDTGWIASDGTHTSTNQNYIAANLGGTIYNNYGVFNLAGLTAPITSATLTLDTVGVSGTLMYSLFDTLATLGQLDADRGFGNAAGIALHNDLGSGTLYGSRVYTLGDANQLRTISLNAAALSQIGAANGGQFALGGTLAPSVSAVPEPATWAMLMLGFGVIGFALRRRGKSMTRVRFAI